MKPQRKIEILTLIRDQIEKYGLKRGLCDDAIKDLYYQLYFMGVAIYSREYCELKNDFMIWAKSTPYRYKDRNIYAAPPGEVRPRLDYLNKRIEELQKEMA